MNELYDRWTYLWQILLLKSHGYLSTSCCCFYWASPKTQVQKHVGSVSSLLKSQSSLSLVNMMDPQIDSFGQSSWILAIPSALMEAEENCKVSAMQLLVIWFHFKCKVSNKWMFKNIILLPCQKDIPQLPVYTWSLTIVCVISHIETYLR